MYHSLKVINLIRGNIMVQYTHTSIDESVSISILYWSIGANTQMNWNHITGTESYNFTILDIEGM